MSYNFEKFTERVYRKFFRNKNIKVYSHVRSGTHFLMSSLKNIYYPNINLSDRVTIFAHWSREEEVEYKQFFIGTNGNKSEVCPWAGLFGSHKFSPDKVAIRNAIYIYRDGRDVLASMYNFKEFQHKDKEDISFGEYIRTKLDWIAAPVSRTVSERFTPVEHWYYSTKLWLQSEVYKVRYEELLYDPRPVMKRLEQRFGLKREGETYNIPTKGVGLSPHSATSGKWKKLFNSKDLDYFYSIVPKDYQGLWA